MKKKVTSVLTDVCAAILFVSLLAITLLVSAAIVSGCIGVIRLGLGI